MSEAHQKQVLLSVIVLTYNHEKYIEQTLDSVFSQKTSFEYEVLVGDDASSDNTCSLLKRYALMHPQIKLTLRDKNVGANYNAFDLLTRSVGKYVAVLDGDDYWCDDTKTELQVQYLEKNPDVVACTCKTKVVDEDGNEIPLRQIEWVKHKDVFTLDDFDGFHLPGQTSSIIKRNFFTDGVHDMSIIYKNHSFLGDRFSALIYLCEGNFVCINSVMSAYRIHDQGYKKNLTYLLTEDVTSTIE